MPNASRDIIVMQDRVGLGLVQGRTPDQNHATRSEDMTTKLIQGAVNKVAEKHPAGAKIDDTEMAGLRVVVGSRSFSDKLVGSINDGSGR